MAAGVANLNFHAHDHVDDSQRPSIFDVLSEESLMTGLKPAARFIFKVSFQFILIDKYINS